MDEPYDRVQFDHGKIPVGARLTLHFVLTESIQLKEAYLLQRPSRPVASRLITPRLALRQAPGSPRLTQEAKIGLSRRGCWQSYRPSCAREEGGPFRYQPPDPARRITSRRWLVDRIRHLEPLRVRYPFDSIHDRRDSTVGLAPLDASGRRCWPNRSMACAGMSPVTTS
jgi:hypothetical protein